MEKTKNNKAKGDKVMKTKNNVQKAITKTLAAGISLVLISITVNAQDFWKSFIENSGLNSIAIAMVEPISETTKTETYAVTNADLTAFIEETDEPMELENWMTDESIFNSSLSIENETEEALKLESWMTDDSYFGVSTFKIVEETEEPLELEDWMISEKMW